jgi:uncharacterized membrane protein YczE
MKMVSKSNELLWLFGIIFVALGVAICSKADLGVSMIAAPAFVISDAISSVFSFFTVGVTEYILQGLILIILCVVVRRFHWKYLLAFAVAVIYGYTLNLFIWMLSGIEFNEVWLRWVMLIVGDIITAFGVACFFRTYMPLQVYELFVAEVADRFGFTIAKTKFWFDMTLLALSILLSVVLFTDIKTFDWSTIYYSSFHSIGLGTLVTTAINSPLIALMGKVIDKIFLPSPLFPRFENLLKHK